MNGYDAPRVPPPPEVNPLPFISARSLCCICLRVFHCGLDRGVRTQGRTVSAVTSSVPSADPLRARRSPGAKHGTLRPLSPTAGDALLPPPTVDRAHCTQTKSTLDSGITTFNRASQPCGLLQYMFTCRSPTPLHLVRAHCRIGLTLSTGQRRSSRQHACACATTALILGSH